MIDLIVAAIVLSSLGSVSYGIYKHRRQMAYMVSLHLPTDALYRDWWQTTPYHITIPGQEDVRWAKGYLVVTHKRLALYRYPNPQPDFHIAPHEIQGFWRPEKYRDGLNEMWIHARIGEQWRILKVKIHKSGMQRLVRAMKQICTQEQNKAYRRRRPYIHRGPEAALPAEQNLQGAWELSDPVKLYIMPLNLVMMKRDAVQSVLSLAGIQNIAALRRMEGGKPDGLVRFIFEEEGFAFALDNYEAFAADLAEAAKRTLEEPVERKRKRKDDDEDD